MNHVKAKSPIAFLLLSTLVSLSSSPSLASEWQEHKSDHFIVSYHPDVPVNYVKDFTRKCEKYYDKITYKLGFNRFDFWLWDDRAKIIVYKNAKEYAQGINAPAWTGAAVHAKSKKIVTFYYPPGSSEATASGLPTKEVFFNSVLPHEMAHIIFREFIGFDTPIPLWLDEGVACSNEKDAAKKFGYYAKELFKQGKAVTVSQLNRSTYQNIPPDVFYPFAATLTIFLLEELGHRRDFVEFCRELRDGTEFSEALRKVYRVESVEELDKKFATFLSQN
ncbi:MAG: hypothetical protein V3S04_00775 [Candidatus Omnitrophota bacterium]